MDVAILGVSESGRWFAQASAAVGFSVSIYADDANSVLDAIDSVGTAGAGDAVDGTTDLNSAVSGADRVVDCLTDTTEARRERLATVESATETPSFLAVVADTHPVTGLAVALRRPERLVGFHPIGDDSAVGVVRTDEMTPGTLDSATASLKDIGEAPVVVGDGPGFVADRTALALRAEAMRTVAAGVADAATIDGMLTAAGAKAGPLEQANREGLGAVRSKLSYMTETVGGQFTPRRFSNGRSRPAPSAGSAVPAFMGGTGLTSRTPPTIPDSVYCRSFRYRPPDIGRSRR